ncbi:hypothetical protein [Streptomyces sp. NPDC093097]
MCAVLSRRPVETVRRVGAPFGGAHRGVAVLRPSAPTENDPDGQ